LTDILNETLKIKFKKHMYLPIICNPAHVQDIPNLCLAT